MTKWEYLPLRVPANLGNIKVQGQKYPVQEYMNYLGEQGWELVSAVPHQNGGFQLFFKREKTR